MSSRPEAITIVIGSGHGLPDPDILITTTTSLSVSVLLQLGNNGLLANAKLIIQGDAYANTEMQKSLITLVSVGFSAADLPYRIELLDVAPEVLEYAQTQFRDPNSDLEYIYQAGDSTYTCWNRVRNPFA